LFAHYTGWLTNGTTFDSSRDTVPNGQPRTPISSPQGARRVIAGWDAGFEGMPLFDNLDLEDAAREAASASHWAFLFVAAPPRVRGATGGLVNPVAIF
jgi:hypothetical protein